MKFQNLLLISSILLILFINISFSTSTLYWFQSGVTAQVAPQVTTQLSGPNSGGSISIQTINQNMTESFFAFWVGEQLNRHDFIQIGYITSNFVSYFNNYSNNEVCDISTLQRCHANQSLIFKKNTPFWFYEYYNNTYNNTISKNIPMYIGVYGTNHLKLNQYNTFSFNYSITTKKWNLYVNNYKIGQIYLNTSKTKYNTLFYHKLHAIGEYIGAKSNKEHMNPVIFKNFKMYKYNKWNNITSVFPFVSYGSGSNKTLPNLYGVKDMKNITRAFAVGSNLNLKPNSYFWVKYYKFKLISKYAHNYLRYAFKRLNGIHMSQTMLQITFSHILTINYNKTTKIFFKGFKGIGKGSYTGNNTYFRIYLDNNITEKAIWQVQHKALNGKWYNANNSIIKLINKKIIKNKRITKIKSGQNITFIWHVFVPKPIIKHSLINNSFITTITQYILSIIHQIKNIFKLIIHFNYYH